MESRGFFVLCEPGFGSIALAQTVVVVGAEGSEDVEATPYRDDRSAQTLVGLIVVDARHPPRVP